MNKELDNRSYAVNLAKRYRLGEELDETDTNILNDACSNAGQQLDNIGNTPILVDIIESFLKD